MWRLYCITLVLGLVFCHGTSAQINLKVGYRLGIVDAPVHNAILEQHNDIMDSYTSVFRPLKSLHGFELALRQRVRNVSMEIGWKLQRNMSQATGLRADGKNFHNELTYSFQAASTGLYAHFGQVSIGGTFDYNFLKLKIDLAEPELKESFTDNLFSSDFSLTYTFPSDGVITLAFQPYMRVNWGHYDLAPLNDALTDYVVEEPEAYRENFATYGISIIVFNGRQR